MEHPLDDLESEDTWSLVLLELPATTSSSGSASPLVGLEEGLGGSHHGCLGDSPGLWCSIGCIVIAPCGAMFTPDLDLWRGNVSPLNVKTVG